MILFKHDCWDGLKKQDIVRTSKATFNEIDNTFKDLLVLYKFGDFDSTI